MAFGNSKKKKKEPVTRKLTQTHKITIEGVLSVENNDQILIDLEDIGVTSFYFERNGRTKRFNSSFTSTK